MDGSELHVQASVWNHCLVTAKRAVNGVTTTVIGWSGSRARPRIARSAAVAVLVMEGEAPDRWNGGAVSVDALHRAVLARGLKLTADLEHLQMRPIPGWRLRADHSGAVTLEWPHPTPLLIGVPMGLPPGWWHAVAAHGSFMLLVGCKLGLHEHAGDPDAHPVWRLEQVAEAGALAAGAVAASLPAGGGSE